jgi:hypothetical protein
MVVDGVVPVAAVPVAVHGVPADFGCSSVHLDEFVALEAEIDICIVLEHVGVVCPGQLQSSVDVAFDD